GVLASSAGAGRGGVALRADSSNTTGGMAGYFANNSPTSTLQLQNSGAGEVLMLQGNGGSFIRAVDNAGTDVKFRVSYTGTVFADGPYTQPAADFAEMLP